MIYCKECLEPNTRPGSSWDSSDICTACEYHKSIKEIYWPDRREILLNIVDEAKKDNKKSQYDCIVGVSGGKDSTRQALYIRDNLGLNPLLVCMSYPPSQVTDLGSSNLSNLIRLGFDLEIIGPSPILWKKLIKEAFFKFSNWGKATEMALFSAVPIIAINYDIPLVIWGENPGLQIGDFGMIGKNGWDGNNMKSGNTLAGGDISWMEEMGISEKDLIFFRYPIEKEFEAKNINIIYLGWFIGDWNFITNGRTSLSYGLSPRLDPATETGDASNVSSLDEDWVIFNQMIKYYKFGFGKTTEYVNEQIRVGSMSRDEAIKLVEQYDGKCADKYIDSFCDYINITKKEFWEVIDKNVNKKLFTSTGEEGKYVPNFKVGLGLHD